MAAARQEDGAPSNIMEIMSFMIEEQWDDSRRSGSGFSAEGLEGPQKIADGRAEAEEASVLRSAYEAQKIRPDRSPPEEPEIEAGR